MSSESGIPTFRDGATGLWDNVDPDRVASIQGFHDDPDCVWAWHTQLKKLVDRCAPNSGHRLIASLEKRARGQTSCRHNAEHRWLPRPGGNTRVYELHGSIHRLRCHRNCGFFESWEQPSVHRASCPSCGAPVRPDVTWFGEGLNEDLLDLAEAAAHNADVFIAIGTSASVYPAAALPLIARVSGACVIEVNPYDTQLSQYADYVVRSDSTHFLTELIERP